MKDLLKPYSSRVSWSSHSTQTTLSSSSSSMPSSSPKDENNYEQSLAHLSIPITFEPQRPKQTNEPKNLGHHQKYFCDAIEQISNKLKIKVFWDPLEDEKTSLDRIHDGKWG